MSDEIRLEAKCRTPNSRTSSADQSERLAAELEVMRALAKQSSILALEAEGDAPKEYKVTLRGKGISRASYFGGNVEYVELHQFQIRLDYAFPKRPPEVRFTHAGAQVVVDIHSAGGSPAVDYTQVHFRGRQPTVRCEVYPDGMWSRVGKLMGMEDVEIDSPEFDDRYIIKESDHAALRDLLSPIVQQQIERLRQFLGNRDIYVSFNRRELLVKKLSLIRDYRRLLEFTQLAIELYDQSVATAEAGIEFVGDAPPPEVTEAVCQICGETIQTDVVFCRRCQTPHHQDCWHYYGACSTYGCRETRYLRPESRRAKRARKKIRR